MSALPKKKASGKDATTAAEVEVGVLLNDLGQALLAASPFVAGGPLLPPPPWLLRCPLPLHLLLQVRL